MLILTIATCCRCHAPRPVAALRRIGTLWLCLAGCEQDKEQAA